jgi:hypothetical protein
MITIPDLRSCQKCERSFTPRAGSGGSVQRFCCTECRLGFHKERQRSERRALYAGPTALPTSEQPAQDETLSREPALAALRPWETGTLDIAGCDRTEFVLALKHGETAGTRPETWPPDMRMLMDQHVSRWAEDNKEKRTIRAMTVAGPKYGTTQSCVVILHHSPKHDGCQDASKYRELVGVVPAPRGGS